MKRGLWLCGALAAASCGTSTERGDGGDKDLTFVFPTQDLSGTGTPNACGDFNPSCTDVGIGPSKGKPFPLHTDMPPDPNENDDGVGRDPNGYLGLNQSSAAFDYLWLANSYDWQDRGTISKVDAKAVKEVARYYTVTCYGLKNGGSTAQCDGMKGCCAVDSYPQWQNRKNNQASGPYQAINLMPNDPSRTAIDFNGDAWVSNRAFSGQSSVTKIANDLASCIDRNGNGKIDTSKDVNGDGIIQTDCNNDSQPDDLASVKAAPCTNGMAQEFFGQDDECVLFTTNTNMPMQYGRPLSLGPGAQDFGPSDAWAGGFNNGIFFRIDGTTGLTKDDTGGSIGNEPYGLTIDSSGYGWSPPLGAGKMCYFDTKKPTMHACARDPSGGQMNGYGVSLDRDQNIWFGGFGAGNAYRYTPDRTNGFANLGNGYWTTINNPGANATGNGFATHRGVAVDSRTPNQYWAWLADDSGWVIRMPGSDLKLPMGADVIVDGSAYPAVQVAGTETIGVGIDRDQNAWGISLSGTVATRIKVDQMGTMTTPDINSAPMGNNKCPAGDRCPYQDNNISQPNPYTYSDFTGFGLRNFTRPTGFYSYVIAGCGGGTADTRWVGVQWDGDVPLNTSLTLKARSGKPAKPDQTWGPFTMSYTTSPADLVNGMPLNPNLKDDYYLQVEFDFATMDKNLTPKLKSFDVLYECDNIPG